MCFVGVAICAARKNDFDDTEKYLKRYSAAYIHNKMAFCLASHNWSNVHFLLPIIDMYNIVLFEQPSLLAL